MNQNDVLERIQTVTASVLKVPRERLAPEARLIEDLDVDSLFIAELALALEGEFDVSVPDKDIPRFVTIGSMVEYMAQQIGVPVA